MPAIRYEISEQLASEPAKLKRIQHKRAVYACPAKHDEATLITAPKPAEAVEKCLAAPGLLAGVVVGKICYHLPGYRMEDILSRGGVNLNRRTLYDWMAAVADVTKPLYELVKQLVLRSKRSLAGLMLVATGTRRAKKTPRGLITCWRLWRNFTRSNMPLRRRPLLHASRCAKSTHAHC